MTQERLNQYCAIDIASFSEIGDLKPLLVVMGSFSGWWLTDWPNEFERACRERFGLDDLAASALHNLLRPTESGFRLVSRRKQTMGLDSWSDLQTIKSANDIPFDVVIGRAVPNARNFDVERDEHLEFLSQGPRQLNLPFSVEGLVESISALTVPGGPTWIVDPHLASWASNPDQDVKFEILKTVISELQRNPSADELIVVSTWKPEHKKEGSRFSVSGPSDPDSRKLLRERLNSLSLRKGFSVRFYLDQGAGVNEFHTHRRYIFNNHGGVDIEYGLADRTARNRGTKAYFGFIGKPLHRQLRDTYSKCNAGRTVSRFTLLSNVNG